MVHGMDGMMIVPLLALTFLGILTHSLPFAAALHALNAFVLLVVAFTSARRAGPPPAASTISVPAQKSGADVPSEELVTA